MKVCPKCGKPYGGEALHCKKCGVELETLPEITAADMPPEELKRRRKKDWITMLIGIPLFLLLVYGIYRVLYGAAL